MSSLLALADERQPLLDAARRPATGLPTGFVENAEAAWTEGTELEMQVYRRARQSEAWDGYLDQVHRATGQRFQNPVHLLGPAEGPQAEALATLGSRAGKGPGGGLTEAQLRQKLEELREADPEAFAELPAPDQAIDAKVAQDVNAAVLAARQVHGRATFAGDVGGFAGGAAVGLANPTNWPFLAIGGGSTLARQMLVQGAAGTLAEAVTIGTTGQLREDVGLAYTPGQVAERVAGAGVGAAGLTGLLHVGVSGLGKAYSVLFAKRMDAAVAAGGPQAQVARDVLLREAEAQAGNPLRHSLADGGEAAAQAHRDALEAHGQALEQGRRSPLGLAPDLPEGPAGRLPQVAVTATGEHVPVEYRIANLELLVASHDHLGNVNKEFPADLQPRDRTAQALRLQVQEIAARLDPERLGPTIGAGDGAPIVLRDGTVIAGNGRVLGTRLAIETNPAGWQRYRDWLQAQGYATGGIERPMLVRSVELAHFGPGPEGRAALQRLARDSNQPVVAAASPAEQAASDAKLLTPAMLAALPPGARLHHGTAAPLIRQFLKSLPVGEYQALTKELKLTPEGLARIERAILARALPDAAALQLVLDGGAKAGRQLGQLADAVRAASPELARLRARIEAGELAPSVDLAPVIAEALQLVRRVREDGLLLQDAIAQADLDRPVSADAVALLRALFADGKLTELRHADQLTALLQAYADSAHQVEAVNLLGLAPPRPAEILAALERKGYVDPDAAQAVAAAARHAPGIDQVEVLPQAGQAAPAAAPLPSRGPWRVDGPQELLYGVTLQRLRQHPDHAAAKAGDGDAAVGPVRDLADGLAERVRAAAGPGEATLLPVRAIETTGRNRLPDQLANRLAGELGWPVEDRVVQTERVRHTSSDALGRIVRPAPFDGPIEAGRRYVLVDDMVTLGSTVAQLRGYVEARGGIVVAVAALAVDKPASARLAVTEKQLTFLRALAGQYEPAFKAEFGHGFDALTAPEAGVLIWNARHAAGLDGGRRIAPASLSPEQRQRAADGLRDRLAQARSAGFVPSRRSLAGPADAAAHEPGAGTEGVAPETGGGAKDPAAAPAGSDKVSLRQLTGDEARAFSPNPEPNERTYLINGADGEPIAVAYIEFKGKTASIENIATVEKRTVDGKAQWREIDGGTPNALGPTQLRQALRQFRELHPEIETITADRLTGARAKAYAGGPMEMKLPARPDVAAVDRQIERGKAPAEIEAADQDLFADAERIVAAREADGRALDIPTAEVHEPGPAGAVEPRAQARPASELAAELQATAREAEEIAACAAGQAAAEGGA